jgi:hypothetical protein
MLGAPGQLHLLAGQEHGRTIPLATLHQRLLPHCGELFDHLARIGEHQRRNVDREGILPCLAICPKKPVASVGGASTTCNFPGGMDVALVGLDRQGCGIEGDA